MEKCVVRVVESEMCDLEEEVGQCVSAKAITFMKYAQRDEKSYQRISGPS